MGRNTWNLWSAGNDRFWNDAAQDSYGLVDLLKMLDNRRFSHGQRFKVLGLSNQPGFRAASKPDEFGLWLDEEVAAEPAVIDRTVYGRPSGILGFRLFPNPDFNEEARKKWDGNRFMNDPTYYNNNKLIRPYRVGVTCGACHIAPNPVNPPLDPENPRWENLASAIGNQYINEGKVFCNLEKNSFFYEMFAAQPRGTSDISRVATDHINNPSAINPIFLTSERARIATKEKMPRGALSLPGVTEEMAVPHMLVDGADSIGVPGAMLRAYVNNGMFSEYWLTLHSRFFGLTPQRPFEISYARDHSPYWRTTEGRIPYISAFFRRLKRFRLADAPGGPSYITTDSAVMTRGKEVFSETCAACHSSKQPPPNVDPNSPEGKAWYRMAVMEPDFLENNFLSNDKRYSVTKIQTNSTRAFDSNAMAGHIWNNFSSQTFKELSPPDQIDFYNPFNEMQPIKFKPKERNVGPGYYRVPSLVSVWTSAPFLHNNAVGKFTGDPSVPGRMDAFNDAIEKLLWPEKRVNKASIWRTQNDCYLLLRKEFLPMPLQSLADKDGYVTLGPIPKGTPINLIANLEPDFQKLDLFVKVAQKLIKLKSTNLSRDQVAAEFNQLIPDLLAVNKCPDFIEDKGHYFGTDLPDSDKRALIEYMKTF